MLQVYMHHACLNLRCYGQVQASVSALMYFGDLAQLPADFPIPSTRNADILDFLHYVFGFQVCFLH